MKIDDSQTAPKYMQLKRILKQVFQEEAYQPGQTIQTETELIERFGVSRNTVRKTLGELQNDGVIYKKQGSGSFFSGQSLPYPQQQSFLIGVIVPRISSYIYPQIIRGIDHIAHEHGYNIVLGSSDIDPEKELVCVDQILAKNIDGLLIEPTGGNTHFENSRLMYKIKELNIPTVIMDWIVDDMSMSYVSPNDWEGGFRATQYLIDAGHRRIAAVLPPDTVPGAKRFQGFKKALSSNGITNDPELNKLIPISTWSEERKPTSLEDKSVAEAVQELIDLGESRPTAIVFYNDEGAYWGYNTIRQAGLKVPDDISIIGFDDSEISRLLEVKFTTVIHPQYQLGKWATDILLNKIENPRQEGETQMVLSPSIAERESVRKL